MELEYYSLEAIIAVGYRVHSLGFYQLVYRLVATGQKVAMVARSVNAHGKVSYRLFEKFGEGETPA